MRAVSLVLSFFLALTVLALAAGPVHALTITPPSSLSFSYREGRFYPLAAAFTWEIGGYEMAFGWLPLDWGPAPGDDLAFATTRGHLMLFMKNHFTGMELIPPFAWEQAYLFLEPVAGRKRYMIARRYEVAAGRWTLGYIEAAVLTGDFSPWYLNPYPLIPLMVTQLTLQYLGDPGGENRFCNAIMHVDARYEGERASAYVAFFADDLPPTSSWANHYKFGLQLGGGLKEPFGLKETELRIDYVGLTRHTYTFYAENPEGDWVDGGLLLGHPLGPDAERLTVSLVWEKKGRWLAFCRERHGEGRFRDPQEAVIDQTLEFLTGTVETTYLVGGGGDFSLGSHLSCDLGLYIGHVVNLANVPGREGLRLAFEAKLTYRF
ncbi:MAG: hypothetical protein GX493_02185 [Firmicutes bacterium]|nr:hypothetical protein [Bacillota bacterium]